MKKKKILKSKNLGFFARVLFFTHLLNDIVGTANSATINNFTNQSLGNNYDESSLVSSRDNIEESSFEDIEYTKIQASLPNGNILKIKVPKVSITDPEIREILDQPQTILTHHDQLLNKQNLLGYRKKEVIAAVLPSADGFQPKPELKPKIYRHKIGRPRMRGRYYDLDRLRPIEMKPFNQQKRGSDPLQNLLAPPNGPNFKPTTKISYSGERSSTALCSKKSSRLIDADQVENAYNKLKSDLAEQQLDVNVDLDRFRELSVDADIQGWSEKGTIEAASAMKLEGTGLISNTERLLTRGAPDCSCDSINDQYDYVDIKTPISFSKLSDEKGIDISHFPSTAKMAYNMGFDIEIQKESFNNRGYPRDRVLHAIDLGNFRNETKMNKIIIQNVLNGNEDAGGDGTGIHFFNNNL